MSFTTISVSFNIKIGFSKLLIYLILQVRTQKYRGGLNKLHYNSIKLVCYQWDQVLEMGAKEPSTQLDSVLKTLAVNECCTLVYTVSSMLPIFCSLR